MRAVILVFSFLPFVYYGAKDTAFHFRGRKVNLTAHVVIGAAALLVYANVPWTFGPFQHLLISPLLHQWHHARVGDEARLHDVGNFGAVFSVWDRLFGTWSLPALNRPACFGVEDAPAPTVAGLALHPLRIGIRFFSSVRRGRQSLNTTEGVREHAAESGIAGEPDEIF